MEGSLDLINSTNRSKNSSLYERESLLSISHSHAAILDVMEIVNPKLSYKHEFICLLLNPTEK